MKEKINWKRILYIIGVVALIIGAVDPLEGSVSILVGSVLLAFSTYLTHDKHRNIFMLCSAMIIIGVFFLFYFSSLGGFGEDSSISWWWGSLVLPYPIGWLISIITLIIRVAKKDKLPTDKQNI